MLVVFRRVYIVCLFVVLFVWVNVACCVLNALVYWFYRCLCRLRVLFICFVFHYCLRLCLCRRFAGFIVYLIWWWWLGIVWIWWIVLLSYFGGWIVVFSGCFDLCYAVTYFVSWGQLCVCYCLVCLAFVALFGIVVVCFCLRMDCFAYCSGSLYLYCFLLMQGAAVVSCCEFAFCFLLFDCFACVGV